MELIVKYCAVSCAELNGGGCKQLEGLERLESGSCGSEYEIRMFMIMGLLPNSG